MAEKVQGNLWVLIPLLIVVVAAVIVSLYFLIESFSSSSSSSSSSATGTSTSSSGVYFKTYSKELPDQNPQKTTTGQSVVQAKAACMNDTSCIAVSTGPASGQSRFYTGTSVTIQNSTESVVTYVKSH